MRGMRRKTSYLVFLLLQMLVFALPCQAEVTWYDVSRSFNSSFSGEQVFSLRGVIIFLAIIFLILAVLIVNRLWLGKGKEPKRDQNQISWRPLGQQQKRQWFRLRTDAEFEWIPAERDFTVKKSHYKKDRLVDISGGGLCFTTAEKLDSNDELIFLLDTGGEKALTLKGQVVRIEEIDQDSAINKVSVQFGKLLSGDRDRIVSYVMNSQRAGINDKKKESVNHQKF